MFKNDVVTSEYQIRPLELADMTQMHRSFHEAFADYAVPYDLSLDQFTRKMLYKVHISFPHSFGAFSNEKLVAFIFHSINQYEDQVMAYNAGTGVIPGHRGNDLPSRLYQQALPVLRTDKIKRCVLEVLTENTAAIKAYKKVGFEEEKTFKCFSAANGITLDGVEKEVVNVGHPNFDEFLGFDEEQTSFGDTFDQLAYNIEHEATIGVKKDGDLAGYLIFQPELGRITRFAVKAANRGQGIGRVLFAEAARKSKKPLTVINVNDQYEGIIKFLDSIGFLNTLDQFEMQLKI